MTSESDLQLGQRIGKGGFGAVYKTVWKGNNVAVKVGGMFCSLGWDQSINQSKRKSSYAKRSLKTKQHTTPDELESLNPMPANHMATPHTGEPQATYNTVA